MLSLKQLWTLSDIVQVSYMDSAKNIWFDLAGDSDVRLTGATGALNLPDMK